MVNGALAVDDPIRAPVPRGIRPWRGAEMLILILAPAVALGVIVCLGWGRMGRGEAPRTRGRLDACARGAG